MIRFAANIVGPIFILICSWAFCLPAEAAASPFFADTLRYPLYDRYANPYVQRQSFGFNLRDTGVIRRRVEYDPVTRSYYSTEMIGNRSYRTPASFSMQEFLQLKGREDEVAYFRKRASMLSEMNRRLNRPRFRVSNDWYNRIMGVGPDGKVKIDIKPAGYVDFLAGYQGQNIKNPTLPERARRNGGFDFNMSSQLQMDAQIGEKLKLPINYNTLANFNFDNQLKLDFKGQDDDIIKQFEAGNTSFASKGTLIPGAQSLFGVKTQLQFGKLFVTTVLADQRSQRQSMGVQGGATAQRFTLKADEYDENRHFLMAHYFRNQYNQAMKQLPVVNSRVQILRVEAWVTNRNGTTTDTRDVVAFMDLGESRPYSPLLTGGGNPLPQNGANNLYSMLVSNPAYRNSSQVQSALTTSGLTPVQDFEKTFARKLQPTEYYFNPQIGFISLNQPLQPDEVLGVAIQYTYNGRVYQLGEFSQDVPPDTTGNLQRVLFLKLLKATSQRTMLPIWDLMMKNVYSVGFGQLERQDFSLDILYEEPSLGEKRYLPPADVIDQYKGMPIISQVNLDRLNNQNDPQPDGVFDFIEGFTVISSQSRIIFPVLEPFGHDLDYIYPNAATRSKYLFYPLYDTIKAIAQTFANLNRFKLFGRSRSAGFGAGANPMGGMNGGAMPGQAGSSEYQLGFNIPRGSVSVTAGGQLLTENVDYEINYDLGTLRVVNPSIISAGIPVNINYENNQAFGFQQKNFLGLRLDYLASKRLSLGGTVVRLGERPFFIKQSYGEDPIRNAMYGFDLDYRNDLPRLTKLLDKLPFYAAKGPSSITAYAEAAVLQPGHARQINGTNYDGTPQRSGQVYIDDFEGARAAIDLRFPLLSWTLASVPQGNGLFPEAALNDDLRSGRNRAKLSWYNIEPVLQEKRSPNNPINDVNELSDPRVRQVLQREIFPRRSTQFGEGLLTTFDLAFYPKERGPYNFETDPNRINALGALRNPRNAWGGLMRNIDQTDFETGNIEFIEFWLQDPFVNNVTNPAGGQLYFNLGNISEDILRDGRRQYENGLPTPTNNARVDSSGAYGSVPAIPLQVTNAFSNVGTDRVFQDVGFDGLTDEGEKNKFANYLTLLRNNFGAASTIYQKALLDPSGDNFKPYRDASFDQQNAGILRRYKDINNPHGNSPISNNNTQFVTAFSQYPDAEELNRDNTMNEAEEYFQYRVDILPNMGPGSNYITDVRTPTVTLANGQTRTERWYLFRIPVEQFERKVGNIPDFKSIRFIRMFVTGFTDSVVMRFGKLELIRNQWRKFRNRIDTTGAYTNLPIPDFVAFNTLSVNVEENDQRQPIVYRIPPGIERQQQLSNNNVALFLNEQALSMQICGLPQYESRGVFKTLNMDLRQYGKLDMFIHAESVAGAQALREGDLNAVVRIGNDFNGNYYEVKIPLKRTEFGERDSINIWPEVNNLNLSLQDLMDLKVRRNKAGIAPSRYYRETLANGRTYAIMGNPNLGEVRGIMLGVENVLQEALCAEVWFNELRLQQLDEKGGWAALGRTDIRLSDLGTISLSGSARSRGFGTLEQRVNERSREDVYTADASITLEAGKLLPPKLGMQIPLYAGISHRSSTPEYDPYDLDIDLRSKLRNTDRSKRDSIRTDAQDNSTIKTFNLTNVKVARKEGKQPMPWSASNFDLTYSYIQTVAQNPLIEFDELRRTRAVLGYGFSPAAKPVEPFKKIIRSNSKWLTLIRDFNFNYMPSQFSFRADIFRQFGATRPRNVGGGPYKIPETYNKYFTFDRFYVLQWNLTRSLSMDLSAINNARIDEPFGRIDNEIKKDSVRKNLFKGGRNTQYQQDVTLNYNVPTSKLPLLDWTSLRASYNSKYNWLASSLLARSLGNKLTNSQTRTLNGELKWEDLYNKSLVIRKLNNALSANTNAGMRTRNRSAGQETGQGPAGASTGKRRGTKRPPADFGKPADNTSGEPTKDNTYVDGRERSALDPSGNAFTPTAFRFRYDTIRNKDGEIVKIKKVKIKKVRQRAERAPRPESELSAAARAGLQFATMLKRTAIQYTEDMGTILPGYMDSTSLLGINLSSFQPGFGYVFGYQPDTSWINRFGQQGLLSRDSLVSAMIQQRFNQRLNITAQLSPIKDFTIDLSLDKTFDKQYSELYKDTSGFSGLARLNPYALGSFSISYISFQTLFTSFDPNIVSGTFKQFEANRKTMSARLASLNPYQAGTIDPDGYAKGYGRYAQDVVIPSFLAAYTNKDPATIKLFSNSNPTMRSNPFKSLMPLPNWTITYNGLSRLPGLDKLFTNFSLRHGYKSTLSMNSFNTALLFTDPMRVGYPSFRDTLTGNFIPYFLVPNITIQEAFEPLIEIDMTFTNQLQTRFEFRKSRQLSLSLVDYQLAENRSTEVTFGLNWRKKGLPLIKNIPFGKNGTKLDNDVTMRMDFSLRDDATANSKLDQGTAFGTGGQRVVRIAPSIDYVLNNKVSMRLYFEQNRTIPKISSAFPVTNTRAGVQVRISLAQ
ncbi:MAG: cell surface protein SprA [Chitinophagales bacterium]|nr:cell surface protein SprA [Chitinophagales bacterium]